MIRFLVKNYNLRQLFTLRDCMVVAYKEAIGYYDPGEHKAITKDIANALSWLEDEIEKRETEKK